MLWMRLQSVPAAGTIAVMSMLTDEERDYILRIGEGDYEAGVRRLIRYSKAMRHDLRGVQHGLGIQAALLRDQGHEQAATFLSMSVQQIEQMVRGAEVARQVSA